MSTSKLAFITMLLQSSFAYPLLLSTMPEVVGCGKSVQAGVLFAVSEEGRSNAAA